MSLHILNKQHTCVARIHSAEGGVQSINGNFGRPFSLYGEGQCISLTAQETLNLVRC